MDSNITTMVIIAIGILLIINFINNRKEENGKIKKKNKK